MTTKIGGRRRHHGPYRTPILIDDNETTYGKRKKNKRSQKGSP